MTFLKLPGAVKALTEGTSVSDSFDEDDQLDPELTQCLKEFRLVEYMKNFRSMDIEFSDLPTLRTETIKELIPDSVPRRRLTIFINKKFVVEKKINNGWEIDRSKVTVHESEVIQSGNFGSIFKGEIAIGYTSIDVACKRIPFDGVEITREEIINEVKVMALCRHPNILRCYGAFFNGNVATICLEIIENGDLLDFSDVHEIPLPLKINYLIEITKGLEYLHSKNIIHRDIKAENVLVGNDKKTLKICDFGTSKLSKKIQGTFVGTPVYVAPEVLFGGENKDHRKIDIYSFGILMWEVLSDEQAFYSIQVKYQDDGMKLMSMIHGTHYVRKKTRPSLDHPKLKDLSGDLLRLIDLCWECDPDDRPTAEIILDVLMKVKREISKK